MVPTLSRWRAPMALPLTLPLALPLALLLALPLTLIVSLAAHAQAPRTQPAARPDPLDARASVPPVTHSSSLANYRRLDDAKPVPWREANDTVTRIGGWRVYAREAQPPAAPASAAAARQPSAAAAPTATPTATPAAAATPAPASNPHRGHGRP